MSLPRTAYHPQLTKDLFVVVCLFFSFPLVSGLKQRKIFKAEFGGASRILSRIWVFHEQTKKQKVGSLGAESAKHCS